MNSSAPEFDYSSSFEMGKFCANKVREYDELISKTYDINILQKLVFDREHYNKEMIIYARMCNYFKNLQKHK